MKISEIWNKGQLINTLTQIDKEDYIIHLDYKKMYDPDPRISDKAIRRMKNLSPINMMLLSERIRIRDFVITDINNLDCPESQIFENDSEIPLSVSFQAIVKLGLDRYTILIAIYGMKSCPIDELGRPFLEQIGGKESLIVDYQIISKAINYPESHYEYFGGDDEIIIYQLDPDNNPIATAIAA